MEPSMQNKRIRPRQPTGREIVDKLEALADTIAERSPPTLEEMQVVMQNAAGEPAALPYGPGSPVRIKRPGRRGQTADGVAR